MKTRSSVRVVGGILLAVTLSAPAQASNGSVDLEYSHLRK
jgi:hypothetical protein